MKVYLLTDRTIVHGGSSVFMTRNGAEEMLSACIECLVEDGIVNRDKLKWDFDGSTGAIVQVCDPTGEYVYHTIEECEVIGA